MLASLENGPESRRRETAKTAGIAAVLSQIFTPLTVFVDSCIAPLGRYDQLKGSLLRHGHLSAALCVIAAVVANHIRRVLVPWSGQFIWYHAMTGMKLARTSPHHYIEDSISFELHTAVFWICQIAVIEAIRRRLLDFIVHARKRGNPTQGGWREKAALRKLDTVSLSAFDRSDVMLDLCAVLFLASSLTMLEHAYAESCWCASQIYALTRLCYSAGGSAKHLFEIDIKVLIQRLFVVRWLLQRFIPNAHLTARAIASGGLTLPALHFAIWRGTAYLVRYSNKYFIFLELSDMLVTFGWMAIGLCLLLSWKGQDIWRTNGDK